MSHLFGSNIQNESRLTLVQTMFEGPVDVIGDVHGEIEPLNELLRHLGYNSEGKHPKGRRLVFVGDLVDRGPDSPAVVSLVMRLMREGRAQCVLGNHELNILRGKLEHYNYWFHGNVPEAPESPQSLLSPNQKEEVTDFFRSLPVVLEREDLRVVHACWDESAVAKIRSANDAVEVFNLAHSGIAARLDAEGIREETERNLTFQNENPIKLITSGPERRAAQAFEAGGKVRHEERHPWWNEYESTAFCVCGHYWRTPLPGKSTGDLLFQGGKYDLLGRGKVVCIDFSIGGRFMERKMGESFDTALAALRWPELVLRLHDGELVSMRNSS